MISNYIITAIDTYIPRKKLTNFDLEKMVDTNDDWIIKRTGIRERFLSADNEFASDMAIKAVQNLIDNNSVTLTDVDLIITSVLVPDHLTPSVSALVAGHFGMNKAGSYDLHAACSGFAYGLITANSLLASGQVNKILLLTAETLSKAVDYTDRGTCVLFGDGATAAIIEKSSEPKLFVSSFGTDGDLGDKVYCTQFSPTINGAELEKKHFIQQDGRAMYTFVVKNVSNHIRDLMEKAKLGASDIDWFVPHSANLRMIEPLCERVGFEREKMLTSVEQYGNTSSSSIPLALALAIKEKRIKRGQKILLYGFGGGITYAGAIIQW